MRHLAFLIAAASVTFPLASVAQDAPRNFVEEAHRPQAAAPKARKRVAPAILAVIRGEQRGDEFYNCIVYVDRSVKCSSDDQVAWTSK